MKETACSRIEKILRKRIRRLPPESRIPNEMDLCREFSVSRMTMNKVIGKLVQDSLVYRVKKKGSFVKDKRRPERPIYFLLPVIDYFTYNSSIPHRRVLAGLNSEASLFNRKIEFLPVTRTNIYNDFDWERLNQISYGDQIFIMSFWYKKLFPFLRERECEAVILNNGVWIEDEYRKIISDWYSVSIERKIGVENAVMYLARTGRKKPLLLYYHEEREHPVTEGFKSGLKKAGLNFSKELSIYMKSPQNPLNNPSLNFTVLHKKYGVDSILAADPSEVKTLIDEVKKTGLRIPEDISVLCLDEDVSLTEIEPPISSIASPHFAIGQDTARIFNREIFLPGETRFRQTLIERESTKAGTGNTINPEYLPELKTFEIPLHAGIEGI
ncbi:MAG: hypothetical protein A2017_10730 [Lentisphaerae bacterium GWF2_44_16]|nr:MAG: hypothetical protein A2017_10730 [Lentisphaerae bacterium GWF2_44_16]